MTDPDAIEVNDDTRPCAEVVNLAREQNRRRLKKINDEDLLRALYSMRPSSTTEEDA